MKTIYKIMNVFTHIYTFLIFYLGAFLIQAYTAYVVYLSYGTFLGLIAFCAPIISEIIMFVLYLIFYGLLNGYCIIILIYLGLIGISFALSYITAKLEEKTIK